MEPGVFFAFCIWSCSAALASDFFASCLSGLCGARYVHGGRLLPEQAVLSPARKEITHGDGGHVRFLVFFSSVFLGLVVSASVGPCTFLCDLDVLVS